MKNPISMIIANEQDPTDLETLCPWRPCGTTSVFVLELKLFGLDVTVHSCGNHASKLKQAIFCNLKKENKVEMTKEGNL